MSYNLSTETLTLEKYLKVNNAYKPSVLPSQQAFTFLSKKSGTPQVWKYEMTSNKVKQYSDLKDRILSVYHSPSGSKTLVGMDKEGDERQQLYLITDNGKEVEELVVSQDHFHKFGGWSPDENQIVFSSNRRKPGYFDVYVYDLNTEEMKVVLQHNGNCTPICWTKDGESLIISFPETNIDQSIHVLDIKTGNTYKLGKENRHARYDSIQLESNGNGGFLLTDLGGDYMGIYRFNISHPSELKEMLMVEQWDIEEIKLSPDDSKLAFTVNQGGTSMLGIYNLKTYKHSYVKDVPTGVYQSLSWLDESQLVIGVTGATLPGDIWKVDIHTGDVARLTEFGKADIDHLWMEPELHKFSSFDNLEVPYFLYGKKNNDQPVVVYVHGGPESQIRSEFNPAIQYLAGQGFAVATPNVRGSMGYGRKYVKMDDGRNRMDSVADLKWLVRDLVEKHHMNPNKVGVMGRSYGGFMVLAAITHHPDIWTAAVDIVGISHFRTFLENTGSWRRKLREFEYGSLEKDIDFFEEIAPLNHTEKIEVPLLIFHGRNDTRVPVSEAKQLAGYLEEQDKKVELVIFDDEGHQTEKMENHIRMNTDIVRFMQKYLKND